MNSEFCQEILSAQIQLDAGNLRGQHFTEQMDKTYWESNPREVENSAVASLSADSMSELHVNTRNIKGGNTNKQKTSEDSHGKGSILQSIINAKIHFFHDD